MTKRVLFFLCIVSMVGGWAGANAATVPTMFYEARLKSSSFGDMGTRKMWIKGGLMRWESSQKDFKLTLIKNGQGVFLLHPWRNSAGKYPAGSNRDNPRALLPGPTGSPSTFLASVKAKQCGREKVGKDTCVIHSYTDPYSKRNCKLWVSNRTGKPVKLVLKGEKGKLDTITATYTRFEPGAKVNDSLFSLPVGCQVKTMPAQKAGPDEAARKTGKARAG